MKKERIRVFLSLIWDVHIVISFLDTSKYEDDSESSLWDSEINGNGT